MLRRVGVIIIIIIIIRPIIIMSRPSSTGCIGAAIQRSWTGLAHRKNVHEGSIELQYHSMQQSHT